MKNVWIKATIIFAALAVLTGPEARGDSVTLKDGTELECQVTGYDNNCFYISALDILTNIPSVNVERIQFAPGAMQGKGQPRSGNAHAAGAEAARKLDLKELDWVKTALAQPRVQNTNPKAITANRIDMIGQLVKMDVPYRSDIRQQTDRVYAAQIGEMGNHIRVSFGKDGLEYIRKIPEMKDARSTKSYSVYGVILSDQMKLDLSSDTYQVGDMLLLGRIARKDTTGKTSYSW